MRRICADLTTLDALEAATRPAVFRCNLAGTGTRELRSEETMNIWVTQAWLPDAQSQPLEWSLVSARSFRILLASDSGVNGFCK